MKKRRLDCLVFNVTFTGNCERFLQASACKWMMFKGPGKLLLCHLGLAREGLTWNFKVRELRKNQTLLSKWLKKTSSLVCCWMLSSKTRGSHSLEGALPPWLWMLQFSQWEKCYKNNRLLLENLKKAWAALQEYSEDHVYFYLQLQLMSLIKLLKNQSECNSHISNEYNTVT